MSLASDYADAIAAAKAGITTAVATRPAPFVGPNGQAEVTDAGKLKLTPKGTGIFEIGQTAALLFRDWITATFG